jgi:hypothetical protein
LKIINVSLKAIIRSIDNIIGNTNFNENKRKIYFILLNLIKTLWFNQEKENNKKKCIY